MLKVKVELYPHGYVEGKQTLAELLIINDGTGTREKGNYNVIIHEKGTKKILKKGKVKGYKRLEKPVWDLVAKAIKAIS